MGFHPILALSSNLYRCGLALDRALKSIRSTSLPRPVVSIGNLTLGGSGKTPLLIRLLFDLSSKSLRPAVLSRGYRGAMRASSGENDEAILLKQKFPGVPIGLGANRVKSAHEILAKEKIDLFLLDDGFQHWRLKRDLDIVCLDGLNPWGGGHLVPWGRLREPASGLSRAGAIVVTRSEFLDAEKVDKIKTEIREFNKTAPILFSFMALNFKTPFTGETTRGDTFNGKAVCALSAVGHPAAFESNLRQFGMNVRSRRFMDHYEYKPSEVAAILKEAGEKQETIITTEKDWVKLKRITAAADFTDVPVWIAQAALQFDSKNSPEWKKVVDRIQHGVKP